jgi:acetate kinase
LPEGRGGSLTFILIARWPPELTFLGALKWGVRILVVNSGSSSIKFAVYRMPEEEREVSGSLSHIGQSQPAFLVTGVLNEPRAMPDHGAALRILVQWLNDRQKPDAVGHRIVHGGPRYSAPQRVTPQLISELRALAPLAPNHLPREIEALDQMTKLYPEAPQIACFDTAFHRRMPALAQLYALPEALRRDGMLQRYGFHGLSYEYICSELEKRNQRGGRTVICHLGNGASMAAVRDLQPIDTTMGFTPTGGIVMSTRCGDIDPEVVLYLIEEKKFSPGDVRSAITGQSGMLGISGRTGDMQELHARENVDPAARLAIDAFCYSACKAIGALAATLGGLDRIVFTGGIGENDAVVRQRICEDVGFLGAVRVDVIPTNEELMISRHTRANISDGAS